ncbi:hypothetical protein D9M70_452640 [compost metagenome]
MARLLDDGSHASTSGVIVSWNSALTNFTASTVFFEFSTTVCRSSCTEPPKAYRMARIAIAVSSSADSPTPTGMARLALILRPAARTSSQVSGGFMPASSQRSLR